MGITDLTATHQLLLRRLVQQQLLAEGDKVEIEEQAAMKTAYGRLFAQRRAQCRISQTDD